jgi:hypothetical protein
MASGIVEPSSQGASQEQARQKGPQGVRAGERSKLVQRLLDAASDLPTFITDILATQAVTVVGTEAAAFVIERTGADTAAFKVVNHIRPDDSDAQTRANALQAFQNLIQRCVVEGKDGAIEVGEPNAENEPQYCLITLLRDGVDIIAVTAVITRCMNLERARQRLNSMQLVAGYFEFFSLRRGSEVNRQLAVDHQRILQLSRAVADAEGFQSAAMNLCNELSTATGATRVSIGWLKGRTVKVKALSHTEEFDKKQELIVQLEKTMEECYDQEAPVYFAPTGTVPVPAGGEGVGASVGGDAVNRQAAALSRSQGGHVVLSLPLRRHAEIEGVVTLEFLSSDKINPRILESLVVSVDLLAPQLYDRHENDRWLITKAGLSAKYWAEELLGPKHWIAKLVTIAVILVILVLTNFFNLPVAFPTLLGWADIRMTYHVSAPMTFAAVDKRSIAAPFDGPIGQVFKTPGQHCKKGEPLFAMKTEELTREMIKAKADANKHYRQAQAYAADPTKTADSKFEMYSYLAAKAEADLYQYRIDHATVYAPFDGEVLKGDLTDNIDKPVKEGEEQMLYGSLNPIRAELTVNERDIQDIHERSRGSLATTAMPTDKYPFMITRIIPLGSPKEGTNVITVYATPLRYNPDWRPGMEGEARIDADKATLGWMWTHRLVDFVRLKAWSWM